MKQTDEEDLIRCVIENRIRKPGSFRIPATLPLLNEFVVRHGARDVFANYDAVFIQHHLGPFVPRLKAMAAAGLEPSRCWFVDIPYSTSTAVRNRLQKLGFARAQSPKLLTDPVTPYDKAQEARVRLIFMRVARRPNPRPLVVVDDGAYFLRFLIHVLRHYPEMAEQFVGTRVVEQTTRGHRFLQEHATNTIKLFRLAVVTIARSSTKLGFEAPFIGAAVASGVDGATKATGSPVRVAVIGYGAIGKATVSRLASELSGAQLHIIDTSETARSLAEEHLNGLRKRSGRSNGLSVRATLEPNTRYDLVVGCTGRGSFSPDNRDRLADGAVLVSGSSASIEFNRLQFLRSYRGKFTTSSRRGRQLIHSTITFDDKEGPAFSMLNAGFPVNFDGKIEHLPVEAIQATHCLLYAAAQQVCRSDATGFQPLELETDLWIRRNAVELLKQALTR